LLDSWAIIFALVLVAVFFVIRIPVVKLSINHVLPGRDTSFLAVLLPRGIATAALASLPLQQGVTGGEFIQNVAYGVVLFSIVFTSILVVCVDKTKLAKYFSLVLAPVRRSSKTIPPIEPSK
jgi:cell volume regulation protein A